VEHKRARVDIPDNRNFVAIKIELRAFTGTPVRCDLRKFANDKRLDIRPSRFFVVQIGAHIADVRIGEANNLPRVAGIGENFLVTGKTCIENDFSAAARDGAGRAAVKYAPVFEREYGGSVLNVRQWILRQTSFVVGLGCGQGTEVVHGPVSKHGATINVLAGDRTEYS
jgi:hypothetical protein